MLVHLKCGLDGWLVAGLGGDKGRRRLYGGRLIWSTRRKIRKRWSSANEAKSRCKMGFLGLLSTTSSSAAGNEIFLCSNLR